MRGRTNEDVSGTGRENIMIKRIQDLTAEEKKQFYERTKSEYEEKYGLSWELLERKMQREIDATFDDELFPKMSPDDQIDAAYARKEFGKNKPSLVDYMLWAGKFVTHSDYVEIPDE